MKKTLLAIVLFLFQSLDSEATAQQNIDSKSAEANIMPFELSEPLEGFRISGEWFPNQIAQSSIGLQGPAVFQFENIKTNKKSYIAVNDMTLLETDYWQKQGIKVYDYFGKVEELVAKAKNIGRLVLPLSESNRAKQLSCGETKDKCLQFGSAIVDFQDVDFDGKKELIILRAGVAQRGTNTYEAHAIENNDDGSFSIDPLYDKGKTEPLNSLDDFSSINMTKKQITIHASGGACASSDSIYSKTKNDDFPFLLTHYTTWDLDAENHCYKQEYAVEADGNFGRRFKLISRVISDQ